MRSLLAAFLKSQKYKFSHQQKWWIPRYWACLYEMQVSFPEMNKGFRKNQEWLGLLYIGLTGCLRQFFSSSEMDQTT